MSNVEWRRCTHGVQVYEEAQYQYTSMTVTQLGSSWTASIIIRSSGVAAQKPCIPSLSEAKAWAEHAARVLA